MFVGLLSASFLMVLMFLSFLSLDRICFLKTAIQCRSAVETLPVNIFSFCNTLETSKETINTVHVTLICFLYENKENHTVTDHRASVLCHLFKSTITETSSLDMNLGEFLPSVFGCVTSGDILGLLLCSTL